MESRTHTGETPSTPPHSSGKQEGPIAKKREKPVAGKLGKRQGGQAAIDQREPFARASHEDDDGYDPWSDRPVRDSLWEEDPWR